jgi:hypothetical protein
MEFKLTRNSQLSHHDKDGKDRNYISYYLNDILILKQKIPFNTRFEEGFDRRISIYDEYILNDRLYQKRRICIACGCFDDKIRNVSFPLSKKIMKQFNIPNNEKILIN